MGYVVHMSSPARRSGIDLARWFAFVGMVFVNFRIVLGGYEGTPWMLAMVSSLEGRAASLFVVLAGIGLGWTSRRSTRGVVIKRGLFLLVVGLLNSLIFSGDILHFYGVWFVLGAFVMRWRTPALLGLAAAVVVAAAVMIPTLDYEAGWQWETLTYTDFWTAEGMVRHLFFNGWHPVFPWFAFLLVGLVLSRLDLGRRRTQVLLLVVGASVSATAQIVSHQLVSHYSEAWSRHELASALFGTASIPPMPLYVLAAGGSAVAVLGACLVLADVVPMLASLLAPAGRQTLSLYLGHIVVGMGGMWLLGMEGSQSVDGAVLATVIFCLLGTVAAWLWGRRFAKGPIEACMRRLTG